MLNFVTILKSILVHVLQVCKHVEHDKSKAYNTQRIDMLSRIVKKIKRCNVYVLGTYFTSLAKESREEFVMQKRDYQPEVSIPKSILCLFRNGLSLGGSYGKH